MPRAMLNNLIMAGGAKEVEKPAGTKISAASYQHLLPVADIDKILLRFDVGARLICKYKKGWTPGKVAKIFYKQASFPEGQCAPYQVRLDVTDRAIFVPRDSDDVARHMTPSFASFVDAVSEISRVPSAFKKIGFTHSQRAQIDEVSNLWLHQEVRRRAHGARQHVGRRSAQLRSHHADASSRRLPSSAMPTRSSRPSIN